jgi:hypothetical protein
MRTRIALALAGGLALAGALMPAAASAATVAAQRPATTSTYYYENTSTSKYALAADQGVQVPLGAKASATTFTRIHYEAYQSVGYYEYADQTTFLCLKVDPNINHSPIVEEPCAAGNEEELFSDPPNPRSLEAVETYGNYNSILQSLSNAMAECDTSACSNDNWALPAG